MKTSLVAYQMNLPFFGFAFINYADLVHMEPSISRTIQIIKTNVDCPRFMGVWPQPHWGGVGGGEKLVLSNFL